MCSMKPQCNTHVALANLFREKNTSLSHCPRGKTRRMSPQDQEPNLLVLSCCCCTKAKSGCIRRLKTEKTEDMKRGAPSPSFAHSELFREKPRAQHVLLLMPQWLPRALKGLQPLDLHSTCSLQTQRRPQKWEGEPPRENVVSALL